MGSGWGSFDNGCVVKGVVGLLTNLSNIIIISYLSPSENINTSYLYAIYFLFADSSDYRRPN